MDTWTVALTPDVEAELDDVPADLHDTALALLDSLREDRFPPDHVKLVGHNDLYRLRLDGWRIVYRVNLRRRQVKIRRIRPRGVVYRGL